MSGHTTLPEHERELLHKAVRLQWVSLFVMALVVTSVGLVAGQSQAMRTAFAEDALALLPPIVFLVGVWRTGKSRDPDHPYGHHRAIGAGHLVAAVTLLVLGASLVWNGASGLVKGEHPPIGVFSFAGVTVWAGWLMIVVMAIVMVPPMILGRLKMKLARPLHDKVLSADADMNKADWTTGAATIAGVTGIGFGLWWADSVAAILVSLSILWDGWKNIREAVRDLLDARASEIDSAEPHPLVDKLRDEADRTDWVDRATVRVRDMGHVFHSEVMVVPRRGVDPTVDQVEELRRRCQELDWKTDDTVVVVMHHLPKELVPPDQSSTSGTNT
ncbi:cation transporter [Tessaracoccus rhinocerotis]|uniref:Cation transporter n=1 Tax=Tessaracoccus rhinocerotis TaxID=1689449 RepID=A0A553K226_9ACTN|nr:cation diffusion facilitator family transporter [Tessaracoccus rhinocerotis]TRY18745.1 cation transporter [Tessaracoccus rhinocerotis]